VNKKYILIEKIVSFHFSSLLTKLAASKQEAKQTNGGQNNSDTFKLYINPATAATVGSSSSSALQVKSFSRELM
jgi:hypothetical protein